ncbi:MAG: alpha/beta hydrolase [Planctomycetaceae bacterium]|nr:alpha/beta hydrolase [Planctomycetaceae bacterium]
MGFRSDVCLPPQRLKLMLVEEPRQIHHRKLNVAIGPDNGPPLLLLHGVTRRWQTFLPLLPQFVLRHTVYALDHRGHGQSDRADSYLVKDYCDDVFELVRDHMTGPLRVYGHSLGAMVAAAVAAEFPDRVVGAILEDPPMETMGERIVTTPLMSMFQAYRDVAEAGGSDQDRLERISNWEIDNPQDNSRRRMADMRDQASLRFTVSCLKQLDPHVCDPILERVWLKGFDGNAAFDAIQCPTMLLQADIRSGGMLTDDDAVRVCQNKMITREQFLSTPHQIHWAETQQVLNLSTNFLESL